MRCTVVQGHNKAKNHSIFLEAEELPIPIVCIDKDAFVLVDDVLLLLGRAAMEPLPQKDDKGPQNRVKDAAGEEFNKDYSERDERRLTELGRRTIELFVLAHIFSKIDVAYQEAVALKKQEELIREEEAAYVAELEQRTRRGTTDKEKKSKRKQGKQKRSNRKGKDRVKDDKNGSFVQDTAHQYGAIVERNDLAVGPEMIFEKFNAVDDASDVSDSVDCVPEILLPESEDGAASPVSCVTDTLHDLTETSSSGISGHSVIQNGTDGKSKTVVDDCSSTCSSDSAPSLVMNKGNSHFGKNGSPFSGQNQQHKRTSDSVDWVNEEPSDTSESAAGARHPNGAFQNSNIVVPRSHTIRSSEDRAVNETKHQESKKGEETITFLENSQSKDAVGPEVSEDGSARRTSLPRSPSKSIPSIDPPKSDAPMDAVMPKKQPLDTPKANNTVLTSNSTGITTTLNPDAPKFTVPNPAAQASHVAREKLQVREVVVTAEKLSIPLIPAVSRPSSAPLAPGLKPIVSVASIVETAPALSHSVSAVGRLGLESTASATPSFVPQSYRNAMMSVSAIETSSTCPQNHPVPPMINTSHSFLQEPAVVSAPSFSPHPTDRLDLNPLKPSPPFGMANHHDILQNRPLWIEQPQSDSSLKVSGDCGPLINLTGCLNLYNPVQSRSQNHHQSEFPACTSGRQTQGHVLHDEFPHLDIINELLDDEHGIGLAGRVNSSYQNFSNVSQSLNRYYSFPGDPGISSGLGASQSSCRFDRSLSYHGDLHDGYGASGIAYDTLGDMIPQSGPQQYVTGWIDGFMPRHWQIPPGSDLHFPNVRVVDDAGGYSYRMPGYLNLDTGINGGYTVFQQPNGL